MKLLPKEVKFPSCKKILEKPYIVKWSKGISEEIKYQCNKKKCRAKGRHNSISIKAGTWFSNSKISLHKSLFLTYCFVHQLSHMTTMCETSINVIAKSEES